MPRSKKVTASDVVHEAKLFSKAFQFRSNSFVTQLGHNKEQQRNSSPRMINPVKFIECNPSGGGAYIITQLMEVYQVLCTACNLINQIFQLQILCFALNSFLGIVFFMYYILIFQDIALPQAIIDRVVPYLWIQVAGCILDMVSIVCACSYVTRSVR